MPPWPTKELPPLRNPRPPRTPPFLARPPSSTPPVPGLRFPVVRRLSSAVPSVRPLRLQPLDVRLPKLGYLRRDDRLAVALVRVAGEVLLMVLVGPVEDLERGHLGHEYHQ